MFLPRTLISFPNRYRLYTPGERTRSQNENRGVECTGFRHQEETKMGDELERWVSDGRIHDFVTMTESSRNMARISWNRCKNSPHELDHGSEIWWQNVSRSQLKPHVDEEKRCEMSNEFRITLKSDKETKKDWQLFVNASTLRKIVKEGKACAKRRAQSRRKWRRKHDKTENNFARAPAKKEKAMWEHFQYSPLDETLATTRQNTKHMVNTACECAANQLKNSTLAFASHP